MNTSTSQALAERSDIHKSCKALEVVVNLLNDYCEAAGAVVQLQKKLAKAVRETASLKTTPEYAGNTFSTCAMLLEALSEVDNKFAKLADKECEGLSSDVRKWFKKLAKEEKAHDERIIQATTKIKQAGLSYEKKSKKSPREAGEEHSRYLALVGSLGPEMNQDKYNHTMFVTQKHSTTTMNVAACLARITDAEWLRSCENVRRFAPNVGQLGEWRAYCEGGWTGQQPPNLPEVQPLHEPFRDQRQGERPTSRNASRPASRVDNNSSSSRDTALQDVSPSTPQISSSTDALSKLPKTSPTSSPILQQRREPISPNEDQLRESLDNLVTPIDKLAADPEPLRRPNSAKRSSTSLASLAAFPSPPTHFPIPAVHTPTGHRLSPSFTGQSPPNATSNTPSSPAHSPSSPPGPPNVSFSMMPRVLESAQEEPVVQDVLTPVTEGKSVSYPFPVTTQASDTRGDTSTTEPLSMEDLKPKTNQNTVSVIVAEPVAISSSPVEPLSPADTGTARGSTASGSQSGHGASGLRRGDYLVDREFGVERPSAGAMSKSFDAIRGKNVHRNESAHSSGSMVAAMRGRYSHSNSPTSPPPRDIPKLSQSVSDIANKYRPSEVGPNSSTPLRRTTSPPVEFPAQTVAPSAYRTTDIQPEGRPSLGTSISSRTDLNASSSSLTDDVVRRRKRMDELEELEYREREYELRMKEREIEQRARDLERDRVRLTSTRGGQTSDGYISDGIGNRSRADRVPPSNGISRGRFASSATHLVLPSSSSSRTPSSTPSNLPNDHAPYCGCASCSAMKYGRPDHVSNPYDLRPPEVPIAIRPQSDKPKGWMRRLSMPVGAAFSLNDSKKNTSPNSNRNSMPFVQDDNRSARRGFDPKSPGNHSVTNFGKR